MSLSFSSFIIKSRSRYPEKILSRKSIHRKLFKLKKTCSRKHGLVVKAVAFEAIGPGFDSSSDQIVFSSLLGH